MSLTVTNRRRDLWHVMRRNKCQEEEMTAAPITVSVCCLPAHCVHITARVRETDRKDM